MLFFRLPAAIKKRMENVAPLPPGGQNIPNYPSVATIGGKGKPKGLWRERMEG